MADTVFEQVVEYERALMAGNMFLQLVSGCKVWITSAGESFAKGHNVWGWGYEQMKDRPADPSTEAKENLRFALKEGRDKAEVIISAARVEEHTVITKAARDANGRWILHVSRFGCLLAEIVGVPDRYPLVEEQASSGE